jgi:FAD/FMN-containing dehydrogenase
MLTENAALLGSTKGQAAIGLQRLLKGKVLFDGEPAYDTARKLWNGMIDRKPLVICQCLNINDIRYVVAFAKNNGMPLSIRGGGHNVAGNAVCEDGVMIDLSMMKALKIDKENKTVRAEAGVTWAEFDQLTLGQGLATTGGTVSTTGISGLTLGGGLGWFMAKYGFTCDNLLSAEIVLPNGDLVTANENDHSDLFWALRGGGGNFGVIASFTYQLHPLATTVIGGMILYPIDQAKEVLQFYRQYADSSPDDLTVFAGLFNLPDGAPVVAIVIGWFGEEEEGKNRLKPLKDFGRPMGDTIGPIPYKQLQTLFDAACPFGMRRYWKSGFLPSLDDGLLDIILKHTVAKTSINSFVLFFHIHGKATQKSIEATAFAARTKQWDFDIISQWTEKEEDDKHIAWARDFWREVAPFSHGVYTNHMDRDDLSTRAETSFGINYPKLQAIKKKYDPDNLLRLNINIIPS